MFRALLIFAAVSAASSQNCDLYANFDNNLEIMDVKNYYITFTMKLYNQLSAQLLNGTFYEILTSSSLIFNCEKITYTGSGSGLVGTIESPGCCRTISNPVTTNPNEVLWTITPKVLEPQCVIVTPGPVAMKFMYTTGTGSTLCIINSVCAVQRQGVFTLCRQQDVSPTLLSSIFSILSTLVLSVLNILLGLPPPLVYTTVNQQNCTFPPNNCPA